MKKRTKLLLTLALSSMLIVSCKKQTVQEAPKPKQNVTIKEKEVDVQKTKESKYKVESFYGKMYISKDSVFGIIGEEDLKDEDIKKEFKNIKLGDLYFFKIGNEENVKIFTDVKIENVDEKDILSAKDFPIKLIIENEELIKDQNGLEFKLDK